MAEYNPSKIIKDGNTYNFRDTTKIPLAGSNAISGDLIPSTNGTVNLGSNSRKFSHGYIENLFTTYLIGTVDHGIDINFLYGANLILRSKNYTGANEVGDFILVADDGSNSMPLRGKPSGTLIWGSKNVAMQEDTVPRSGGAVVTGTMIGRADNTAGLDICGGTSFENGGFVALRGKDANVLGQKGAVIIGTNNGSNNCNMLLKPDGTATWGNKEIETIEEQGNEYIRYTNGIQICWGLGAYDNGQIISYVKAFREAPSVVTSTPANADDWSATNFKMSVYNGHDYACWIAIGRWK